MQQIINLEDSQISSDDEDNEQEPLVIFMDGQKNMENSNLSEENKIHENGEEKKEQNGQSFSIVGQPKIEEQTNCKLGNLVNGIENDDNANQTLLVDGQTMNDSFKISQNGLLHDKSKKGHREPFFGKFHFCMAFLLALVTFSCTSMRLNLSMAMVCMVNSTAVHIRENGGQSAIIQATNQSSFTDEEKCPKEQQSAQNDAKNMGYKGTLEWSTAEQARLFGATFYGSFFTIWFSGYLADRFGAKLLISLAIIDFTIVSFLTPYFVSINYNVFFAARIFMGLGEGLVMPTIASVSARWFPPEKRSLLIAICTMGNQAAALGGFLLSSQLCTLNILNGWPTIFYTFGLVGIFCLLLWSIFSSNSLEGNRWIGQKEQKTIERSFGDRQYKKMTGTIPWRQMAKSLPLYSGILCQTNATFCTVIMQSYLPTFFKEVVQLNLENNGLFSVIPFVGQISSKIFFGILADFIIKRKMLTVTNTVKLFQGIANFGAAFAAICIAFFVNCRTSEFAAIFMFLWGISYGANTSGFFIQLISIGPLFSGTTSSFSTAIGIISSGISPIIVSAIVRHGTLEEWRLIWFLLAACNLFCIAFFFIFASAKDQKWTAQNEEIDAMN